MSSQHTTSFLVALTLSLFAVAPAAAQPSAVVQAEAQAPVTGAAVAGQQPATLPKAQAAASPAVAKDPAAKVPAVRSTRLMRKVRHVGIFRVLSTDRRGPLAAVLAPAGLQDSLARALSTSGHQVAEAGAVDARSLRGPAVGGARAFGQTWSLGTLDEDGQVR